MGDFDLSYLSNSFWGVGLRLGADTMWGLGAGFSIYGDAAVSLLSSHFNVHQREKLDIADTTRANLTNKVDNVVTIGELALGLKWDHFFYKDRYHIGVKLGWEFNAFFNQNQFFRLFGNSSHESLAFQGLTLGFRFDF